MTLYPTEFSSHVVTALYIVNILFAFTVIFLERRNPTSTLAWILVLFLLPAAGAFFYILLSQNLTRKKMFQLRADEHQYYASLLSKEIEDLRTGKLTFNDPVIANYKDLIHLHQIQSKALFSQDNKVDVFIDGTEKFKELFKCIINAKEHVHILYFIVKRDSLGKQLITILTEKAREGVEVRLLVDALGNRLHSGDLEPLVQAGGKVVKFFPSFLSYINLQLNYRNHRKLVIIDGKIGFLGGFNVGNEYIGLKKSMGYWRDTHLKIKGTAVHDMQTRFLLDWRTASGEEILEFPKYYSKPDCTGNSGIQIVSSGPDSPQEEIKQGYIKMINSAKSKIYIQTPYFIPDESIQEALKIAALSGVDVRIMIPNRPDHIFVYWATSSFIGDLLHAGIRAFTYDHGFLHSKSIVVDEKISSVGTANFDIRSFKLNFEVNAFIYDLNISKKLHEAFLKDLEYSAEITLERYNNRSNIIKFKESISRLLTPVL
ncbi:MAG: Major cardiolipin synthase ClsA [Candidatus Dichloromethanomonas elyunquensis]|nr:MAG: Major cardiolipin synthase ClsA [Candidatus Dichloromethanomonas elyunquensis]